MQSSAEELELLGFATWKIRTETGYSILEIAWQVIIPTDDQILLSFLWLQS